jgi:hypothetical protein
LDLIHLQLTTIGIFMTDSDNESASLTESPLGDDLPPVQPPSAGFIVQLFVFPAMIVMAVVAIWWMFGLIAVGEQDWHKRVQELQSQNVHIRNRAMYGLAQVLDQDMRLGSAGQHLCANREIAQALSDQLAAELRKNSTSKEGVAIQEYLTRALGMMDSFDVTQPVLLMALEPTRDIEIRKSAVVSLSIVAGRAIERNEKLSADQTVSALIELSGDPLPVLRQSAAYALGLFDSEDAKHQLAVLLRDGDQMTRVNAAIGLARQGSTEGIGVFREILNVPETSLTRASSNSNDRDAMIAEAEQLLILKNVLKAVTDLAQKFDDSQRQELLPLVQTLAEKHPEVRIRVDAESAKIALRK